ncbi:hypothetical protein GCM10027299_56110 [Larkinella ripae]
MKIASLFAGIGGFDLAAEWMGWETVVQVELDEWCRKVLAKNFPNAHRHTDIKTFDGSPYRGSIDLVCGGFPCQPYSQAGKRLGKEDDRHLWPEMLRVIRQIAPRWVVGENVGGLLTWNDGLVFDEVLSDLENEGYQTQAFVIPACGVNAPHRRDRVWIVAHSERLQSQQRPESELLRGWPAEAQQIGVGGKQLAADAYGQHPRCQPETIQTGQLESGRRVAANADSIIGCKRWMHPKGSEEAERHAGPFNSCTGRRRWKDFPTQSPVRSRNDGVSELLDRARTIKAAGNAVVPELVYQLFQAIDHLDNPQPGAAHDHHD